MVVKQVLMWFERYCIAGQSLTETGEGSPLEMYILEGFIYSRVMAVGVKTGRRDKCCGDTWPIGLGDFRTPPEVRTSRATTLFAKDSVDLLRQDKVVVADAFDAVGGQVNDHLIPNVKPFRVMVHFLGY